MEATEIRLRGELLHEDMTEGTFRAYVIGSYDPVRERWEPKSEDGGWGLVTEVIATVSLVPGWSGQDHLFHRALARVADALAAQPIYWTAAKLKRAIESAADTRDGKAAVEIEVNWEAGAPPTYSWASDRLAGNLRTRAQRGQPDLPADWRDKCDAVWRANDRSVAA